MELDQNKDKVKCLDCQTVMATGEALACANESRYNQASYQSKIDSDYFVI